MSLAWPRTRQRDCGAVCECGEADGLAEFVRVATPADCSLGPSWAVGECGEGGGQHSRPSLSSSHGLTRNDLRGVPRELVHHHRVLCVRRDVDSAEVAEVGRWW